MHKRLNVALWLCATQRDDVEVLQGINRYLQQQRKDWQLHLFHDQQAMMTALHEHDINGLIIIKNNATPVFDFTDVEQPCIWLSEQPIIIDDAHSVVYSDQEAMAKLAFLHLKAKGLEHFAYFGSHLGHARERGFTLSCAANGYKGEVFFHEHWQSLDWSSQQHSLSQWLSDLPLPCGLVTQSDSDALRLMQLAKQLGLALPHQLAVVGMDDDNVSQYLGLPSLSSVRADYRQMGFEAASLLQKALLGERGITQHVASSELVARASSEFEALGDSLVIQAMHYIQQYACRGIKVAQVLDALNVSRTNLEQRFKQQNLDSIHQQIHRAKLEQAMALLKDSTLSIGDIAELCGYPSTQYLYAVFNKDVNMTPSAYRQHMQDEAIST